MHKYHELMNIIAGFYYHREHVAELKASEIFAATDDFRILF